MNTRRSPGLRRCRIAFSILLLAGLGVTAGFAQQQEGPAPKPPPVKHDLEGRGACLVCHAAGAMEPVPDVPTNHAERPNEICLMCHAPGASIQTADPPRMKHDVEGRAACMMCHEAGKIEPVPDAPADHEGRADEYCTLCHRPASP